MSDEYTPTTAAIRNYYAIAVSARGGENVHAVALEKFDRWLAAHDAEVRAEQREQDAKIADRVGELWQGEDPFSALRAADNIRAGV